VDSCSKYRICIQFVPCLKVPGKLVQMKLDKYPSVRQSDADSFLFGRKVRIKF
jgi:hypothetical protein